MEAFGSAVRKFSEIFGNFLKEMEGGWRWRRPLGAESQKNEARPLGDDFRSGIASGVPWREVGWKWRHKNLKNLNLRLEVSASSIPLVQAIGPR